MNNLTNPVINLKSIKQVLDASSFIDDDLVLFSSVEALPIFTEPKMMNCLFVAMCLEGNAVYTVDTKEHVVQKNDVIIINDGQVLSYYELSHDCKAVIIMATSDFFAEVIKEVHEMSQLFLFAYSHPVFSLKPEKADTFISYFNIIKQRVDDIDHHFRRELSASLLKAMVYDIGNEIYQMQVGAPKLTRAEFIFSQFMQLVKDNFRQERRVSWYGKQLSITPKYLSEAVKQVSRRTPNDWIDHYVTLEMRVLLKHTTMNIKEIAVALNFPNQSFLGKYFKEHVGMSPSKYRRS
jgi:AraC-like DNA-binding protein